MSFQTAKGRLESLSKKKRKKKKRKGSSSKFFIKSSEKHTISSLLDISQSHPLRAKLNRTCLKEKVK